MKKQLDIKKLLILNLPYILMGLFATNFGEAWRMAQGADASQKALSLISVLPVALESWWPSLHPLDLLVGICCGGGLRLAVYLKSKNAKKYAAVTAQAKLKREEQARQSSRQEIVHSIAEADVLTSELTDLLIEKVYVFPDNRIEIIYKVHDLFE